MDGASPGDLAVYVHWPFCLSKCPYCDFNSYAAEASDHARWRQAYRNELAWFAGRTPGRTVGSVFFGGGTPSLMEPATVAAVLDAVAGHWTLADDAEITLEANPTSVEAGKFLDFRAAGVNRVSIGVQSLEAQALKFLGRRHSADEARQAIALAARTFDRYSFDLIYARPDQTATDWRRELTGALPLARGHLSAYQLTIEPETRFFERRVSEAPDGRAEALYDLTQELLEAAGVPAYEVSNHAAPGQESRHNLVYWQGGDYAGVGPGAHGRLTGDDGTVRAVSQHRAPERWLRAALGDGHGNETDVPLEPRERIEELLMMGLRLTDGVTRDAFGRRAGLPLAAALDPASLRRLEAAGFLVDDARGLRATPAGRKRLNAVLATLLA